MSLVFSRSIKAGYQDGITVAVLGYSDRDPHNIDLVMRANASHIITQMGLAAHHAQQLGQHLIDAAAALTLAEAPPAIVTSQDTTPGIPEDTVWMARFERSDPGDPVGHGPTEDEARANLIAQWEAM